eukprot:gene4956-9916_t
MNMCRRNCLFNRFQNLRCRKLGNCYILNDDNLGGNSILATIGPHFPGVIMSTFMIITGTCMLSLICRTAPLHQFYTVISILFALLSLSSLLFTALHDPGIILSSPIEEHDVISDNIPYCDICNIYQPEGAKHCDMCDVCIENLDHHCPWIDATVGKRSILLRIAKSLQFALATNRHGDQYEKTETTSVTIWRGKTGIKRMPKKQ